MLWKTRTSLAAKLSTSKMTGLALGLCLAPLATSAAWADSTMDTSVTSPSSTMVKGQGLKTAVVAATDTGGDAQVALRALKAAHIAIARSTGYVVIPANRVASTLQAGGTRWPFTPRQWPDIRKKLDKADRALAVTVSPVAGNNAAYSAVVELYDMNNGGLVGRGESTYTVSEDVLASMSEDATPSAVEPLLGSFEAPAGTTVAPASGFIVPEPAAAVVSDVDARFAAIDGAVLRAVDQLNEPAQLGGVIVSLPGGYMARLSKGEMHGLRNGARVEYTVGGRTIAYGTAIDVGKGETLATVAPERAFPLLGINGEFHTVSNPPIGAAGRTRAEIDDREFSRFEKEFGLSAGIVGLAYLLFFS